MTGAAFGGVLCVLVASVAIGTLIGAVFLRAAIALYNKFAGGRKSPTAVPEPPMGKAMGITFVTSLANGIVGLVIGLMVGAGGAAGQYSETEAKIIVNLISFPISLLVMAGMNAALLPTTFPRGLLVALCYLLVVLFVVVVIAVIFGGLYLVLSAGR